MLVPKSVTMYLGVTEAQFRELGALGCVFEYGDESHDILWERTEVVLSSDNLVARYHFVTNRLQSYRSRGSGQVVVSLPDMKSYVESYDSVRGFLSLYERNRRSRLGPDWSKEPWELNPRQAFVIQMPDEAFRECFISDPRTRVEYAAVIQQYTLLLPRMIREPEGFPLGGTAEGPSTVPRTEFPARDP